MLVVYDVCSDIILPFSYHEYGILFVRRGRKKYNWRPKLFYARQLWIISTEISLLSIAMEVDPAETILSDKSLAVLRFFTHLSLKIYVKIFLS